MKQLSQTITLLSATFLTTTVAATLQCKEDEALLEVTYTLSEDEWKENLPGLDSSYQHPVLSVQPSGNYGMFNSSTVIKYENYTSLVDYKDCIPKDDATCFQVSIYMLPITSYEITYDGTVVKHSDQDVFYDTYYFTNDKKFIQYPITSIELGDGCYPVCNEEEHLFDHHQFLGYDSDLSGASTSHLDYNVKDDNDVVVLDCIWKNCTLTGLSNRAVGVYRYRTCLPAKKCYSLLVGNKYPSVYPTATYGLRYNNEELVSHSNTVRVSQTFFGDGCQPRCNEDESIVQLLGHFTGCGLTASPITLNWNISKVNNEESLKDGTVDCNNATSNNILFDEFVCVPRGMCTSLDFGGDIEYGADLYYTITMDDITYRNNEMRAYNSYNPVEKQRKTLLGNCTQSACKQDEDLIDISFRTVEKYRHRGANQTFISSGLFPPNPGSIDWVVDYSDNRYTEIQEENSGYFVNRYGLDRKFRALMCIPSGNCLFDVIMSNDAPVLDYLVKQNGVPKSEDVRSHWSSNLISVTSLGTNCNGSSLSSGAIAGIAIASIVVVLVLLYGGYVLYKKKSS